MCNDHLPNTVHLPEVANNRDMSRHISPPLVRMRTYELRHRLVYGLQEKHK